MAKWFENVRRVKHSKNRHKRFFTSLDMSEAKRAESILNSRIKRKLEPRKSLQWMQDCGCGATGCIMVGQMDK